MQAGKTKAERKANQAARNEARQYKFGQMAAERSLNRAIKKEAAIKRELPRRIAARHDVIAAHKLAYKEQCLAFEASKETEDVSNSGSTN